MNENKKQTGFPGSPSIVWPVMLITAGVLLLLNNLDVLSIDLGNVWRLWPVLLILVGVEVIIGRRSAVGNILVLIITLVVIGGVVILLVSAPDALDSGRSTGSKDIQAALDGVEQAELNLNFAAGELNISNLNDSTSLIEAELKLSSNHEPVWEIDRSNGRAEMSLGYGGTVGVRNWDDDWKIYLSPKAALWLNIDSGAGDATIDLTGLNVKELDVSTGAGRSTIRLPREGDLEATVSGGVGQLVVEIPEGMAAQIEIDRGIGGVEVPRRFESRGDGRYVTSDWDSNDNRVDLRIEIGVGQVTIRES